MTSPNQIVGKRAGEEGDYDPEREYTEAECTICKALAPADRLAMRQELVGIPLRVPVCNKCMDAFWHNITGWKIEDGN